MGERMTTLEEIDARRRRIVAGKDKVGFIFKGAITAQAISSQR